MNKPITLRTLLVTNGLTVLVLVLALLVLLATPTLAGPLLQHSTTQTLPITLPYQGHLTDATGTAITDSLPMTFKLYAAQSGGEPLWTEERSGSNAVPVRDGLFTVQLGSVTPIPASLLAQPLWLGISVDGDAEMSPREIIQTPAMAQRLNQPVFTLLGHVAYTAADDSFVEEGGGWRTVKGSSADEPLQVTVETHGGPVIVMMAARYNTSDPDKYICAIRVNEAGRNIQASNAATAEVGCSGMLFLPDLAPGEHTFSAIANISSGQNVRWKYTRHISVYEFIPPAVQ